MSDHHTRPYRYEYARKTKSDDALAVCTASLVVALTSAFPAPRVWRVNPLATVVAFAVELSGAEKTTLDGVVAVWDPNN